MGSLRGFLMDLGSGPGSHLASSKHRPVEAIELHHLPLFSPATVVFVTALLFCNPVENRLPIWAAGEILEEDESCWGGGFYQITNELQWEGCVCIQPRKCGCCQPTLLKQELGLCNSL